MSNGGDAPVVVDHKNNNNGEEDEGEKKMMVDVQSSPAVKPPHVGRRGAEQCAWKFGFQEKK